ncbi:MAG: hypothetical protein WC375_13305 [Methanomassiliicoccales archaeon]|jgi:hypothetical protein
MAKTDVIDIEALDKALWYADDMFSRSQIEYMLFGDTAYSILHNTHPKYQKISLGTSHWNITAFSRRIFSLTNPDAEVDDHKIKFKSPDGVPIEMRIYYNDYPFLRNPDKVSYRMDTYNIPNPFDKYWKVYRLIQ